MPPAHASPDQPDRSGDRIAKLLARAGVASRREVERMIAEGRIALNGEVVTTPATLLRSLTGVTVDGQPVAAPAPARLFIYHKPPGLLVTERDPAGRPTIYGRLPTGLPRVVPVGRLDLATEGLLLLTTDGGLKRSLELPANGVERTYRARAYGQVSQAQLEELIDGVEVEGVRYGSIDANLERRTGANVWIELTLTEGKNREVRRVLEHLGLQVGRLIRTRYGPFVLGDLQPGEVGEVRQHDLVAFRQTIGGRKGASTLPERVAVGAESFAAKPRTGETDGAITSEPQPGQRVRSDQRPKGPAPRLASTPSKERSFRPAHTKNALSAGPTQTEDGDRRPRAATRPTSRAQAEQGAPSKPYRRREEPHGPATDRAGVARSTQRDRGSTDRSSPRQRTDDPSRPRTERVGRSAASRPDDRPTRPATGQRRGDGAKPRTDRTEAATRDTPRNGGKLTTPRSGGKPTTPRTGGKPATPRGGAPAPPRPGGKPRGRR